MSITPPSTPIPTTIKSTTVTLKRWIADIDTPAGESINYQIVLLDQDGKRIRWAHDQGSLAPQLTPAQVAQAQAFMDDMWTLAEEIL